jgi:hypothetical protein
MFKKYMNKNDEHLMAKRTVAAVCCWLASCAIETSESPDDADYATVSTQDDAEADIALQAQAIAGGVLAGTHRGLLRIDTFSTGGGGCTASLVGARWAVTAAHCFYPINDIDTANDSRRARKNVTVWYYKPGAGKILISGLDEQMDVFAIRTWDNSTSIDYQDDIALIRRDVPWNGTSTSDYLAFNGGNSSGSVDDIYPMTRFGQGITAGGANDDDVLRSAPTSLAGSNKYAMWDKGGSRRVCGGDSGGPLVGKVGSVEVVAGIHSGHSGAGVCAANGAEQWAARIDPRRTWYTKLIGAGVCSVKSHYTQCF